MPIISKFDGGIVTGINDMYLKDEHATVLTNVDIERIGLLSYKKQNRIGTAMNHFYEFPVSEEVDINGEKVLQLLDPPEYFVTSSNNKRTYAEFEGKLCYSEGGPQCRYTEGEMNAAGTEFKWLDMGVGVPDGKLEVRPVTVDEDIGPNMVELISDSRGFINIKHIKYRVVAADGTVYIKDMDDNPGKSLVEWKLPSGYKVYREIIDEYGEHTDQFAFVGEGTFVDGGSQDIDQYGFISIKNVKDYSSYRLCYVNNLTYSMPFTVIKAPTKLTILIDGLYILNENEGSWKKEEYSITIEEEEGDSAIASPFVYKGKIYAMIEIGSKLFIYDDTGTSVYEGKNIGYEFFACTTIEHQDKLYQFDPSNGKVAIFEEKVGGPAYTQKVLVKNGWSTGGIWNRPGLNQWIAFYKGEQKSGHGSAPMSVTFGTTVVLRSTKVTSHRTEARGVCIPNYPKTVGYYTYVEEAEGTPGNHIELTVKDIAKYPHALAEDSIYTLHGDKIYALINDRAAANIRTYDLPSLKEGNVGQERLTVKKVVGLGGSSGCDFTMGDYQIFPVMGGVVTYSRDSNQLALWDNPKAVTTRKPKGFTYSNSQIFVVAGGQLLSWIFNNKASMYDLFDEKVLTGSFVYTVGQPKADGTPGPVMLIETDPVSVNKGHMHIDMNGIVNLVPANNKLNLYRTGGHLTVFKMVTHDELVHTVPYIDKVDDVSLALFPEGEYKFASAPPAGLKYLTSHRGMLFGAVDSKLYWSQPGAHQNWDEVINLKLMDRTVYGLVSAVNGLIIFMEGRISLLAGSEPLEFEMRTVTDDVGSVDSEGIKSIGTGAMFFSNKGLCITDGISVRDMSYDMLGSIEFTTLASATTDRNYYAMVNNWTESDEPFVVMIYDITREVPNFTTIEATTVQGLGVIGGKIAHTNKGELYDTFGGSGDRVYHYKSGNINMGSPTIVKEWDRIRITGEFIGNLKVYLDESVVMDEPIDTLNERVNLHIPKNKNKSKTIKFELLGKGDVISIEYSITDRSTTK